MFYYFIYNTHFHEVLDYFDSATFCVSLLEDYIENSHFYFENPDYADFLVIRFIFIPLCYSDIYEYILDNLEDSYIFHVDL